VVKANDAKTKSNYNKTERAANKILLLLICLLVAVTQSGCKRGGAGEDGAPYQSADRQYSDSSREKAHEEEASVDGLTHTVTAGQSLIALKDIYGISIQAIKKYNPEVSENKPLKIGQKVFIPGSSAVLKARRDSYTKNKKGGGQSEPEGVEKLNWPVSGTQISKFSPASKGIYIKIAPGAAIKSVAQGEVVYSGKMKGYGNLIIVDHLNGLFSIYGLNAKNLVNKGDTVKTGSKVAIGGDKITAGYSKLYFELRNINSNTGEPESVDPLKYLKAEKK